RIRSMALVHEKLYQSKDFAHIDVKDYIQTLAGYVNNTFAGSMPVNSVVTVDDIDLDIDTLVPCGLIINELLTNALIHAFEGQDKPEIRIEMLRADKNNISLTISDNGKGLPDGFDISKSTGLGLKLVEALIIQIRGTLEAKSENGTTFKLIFPEKP
ncbi:MAG: ATP-binding protein, partial [Thermodesulfovibrionales bacterium]|nr:ATP-binding protein [Thermodesulfovibrionales bacterium]